MKLQELLDETNRVLSIIQLNHRNTLETDLELHEILWDIKDCLFCFIDVVGEDIIINGWMTKFAPLNVKVPTDEDEIFTNSVQILESYLDTLSNFYKSSKDLEIQGDYASTAKNLRKLVSKLKGSEDIDEENKPVLWKIRMKHKVR